jgi:hypothetical protein
MAGMRNSGNRGVLVALGGVWAIGVVGVLLFVGEEEGLLRSDRRIVAMQGSRGRMGGLSRAIAGLNAEDKRSSLMLRRGFRTSQLAAAQSEAGLNWLEKIQGKVRDLAPRLPAGTLVTAATLIQQPAPAVGIVVAAASRVESPCMSRQREGTAQHHDAHER